MTRETVLAWVSVNQMSAGAGDDPLDLPVAAADGVVLDLALGGHAADNCKVAICPNACSENTV